MFFKWFVPYGRLGSVLAALFTLPALFAIYSIVARTLIPLLPDEIKSVFFVIGSLVMGLSPLAVPTFNVWVFGYHRMITVVDAIAVAASGWVLWTVTCFVAIPPGKSTQNYAIMIYAGFGLPITILVAVLVHHFLLKRRHLV